MLRPAHARLTLVSHPLCPYVQRAAIVLMEKGAEFQRREVDLANKPDWFAQVSPLGKTPVLLVGDKALFESAVICEYLDETIAPRLHRPDPMERAQHRAWVEFGSATLNRIAALYNAPDAAALDANLRALRGMFEPLESALADGPFFAGAAFGMVDAAFGPVFRYFDVFDAAEDFGVFSGLPRVQGWRLALAGRESVRQAVGADYPARLLNFLIARRSALSRRLASSQAAG